MTPSEAYRSAVINGYSKRREKIACKHYTYAYWFARDIPGADIEKCMKAACKTADCASSFIKDVPGADLFYCADIMVKYKTWPQKFIKKCPQFMEALKDRDIWKDLITQEMIDEYKIKSIIQ